MKTDIGIGSIITTDSDFESILTNPILDIAARFWEEDRYEAFKVCYRSMREIDDLVDDSKTIGSPASDSSKIELISSIKLRVESLVKETPLTNDESGLLKTIRLFRIPLWPWERLAKAMLYDMENDGFQSFTAFLRYAEGAAIAPASIFMHLCGIATSNDDCRLPPYDIRKAARPLAVFSYLVHIIRDFEKDQCSNLNYFAENLLTKHGVSKKDLREGAVTRVVSDNLRNLFGEYRRIADYYRRKAESNVEELLPALRPQYQLSLLIIYQLYKQIFERINCLTGNFSTAELNPTAAEVQQRIELTVNRFRPVR